jgi:hypothetical protein
MDDLEMTLLIDDTMIGHTGQDLEHGVEVGFGFCTWNASS